MSRDIQEFKFRLKLDQMSLATQNNFANGSRVATRKVSGDNEFDKD